MIQTKVRVSHRRGENLLMEPKHTTRPSGMENTNVNMKTFMVSLKPPSSCIRTGMNIISPRFSMNVDAHGGDSAVYVAD